MTAAPQPYTHLAQRSFQAATMRQLNLAGILRLVLREGPLARAEITAATSTSSGAVTKLTSALLRAGIVRELPFDSADPRPGRPRVPLDLDIESRAVLSAHIGLNLSTVAAVDLRGGIVVERLVTHRSADIENVIDRVVEELAAIRDGLGGRRIIGAGITSAGIVDPREGVLHSHPRPEWTRVPVRRLVADGLGMDAIYDNEVRAEAMAELIYGNEQLADNLVTLFVGSVVEAALVVNGTIQRGAHGHAGSLAHLPIADADGPPCSCGRRNCLRTLTTNAALLARGQEQGVVGAQESYDDLIVRAEDGDPEVRRLMQQRARWVGEAVGVIVDLVDPGAVVLSGNATHYDDYLEDVTTSMRSIDPTRPQNAVRLASFGAHAAAVSGAALLLDRYFTDPVSFEPALRQVG